MLPLPGQPGSSAHTDSATSLPLGPGTSDPPHLGGFSLLFAPFILWYQTTCLAQPVPAVRMLPSRAAPHARSPPRAHTAPLRAVLFHTSHQQGSPCRQLIGR